MKFRDMTQAQLLACAGWLRKNDIPDIEGAACVALAKRLEVEVTRRSSKMQMAALLQDADDQEPKKVA